MDSKILLLIINYEANKYLVTISYKIVNILPSSLRLLIIFLLRSSSLHRMMLMIVIMICDNKDDF